MSEHEIDKIAKAAFPEKDMSYDPSYWTAMEARLDGKRKRRGLFWWWGLGLLALGLAIGGVSLQFDGSDNVMSQKPEQQDEKPSLASSSSSADMPDSKEEQPVHSNQRIPKKNTNDPEETLPKQNNNSKARAKSNEPLKASEPEALPPIKEENENYSNTGNSAGIPDQGLAFGSIPTDERSPTLNGAPAGGNLVQKTSLNFSSSEIASENSLTTEAEEELKLMDPAGIILFAESPDQIDVMEPLASYTTEFGEEVEQRTKIKAFVEVYFSGNRYGANSTEIYSYLNRTLTISPGRIDDWSAGVDAGIVWNNFSFSSGLAYRAINQSFKVQTREFKTVQQLEIDYREEVNRIDSTWIKNVYQRVTKGNGFGYELVGAIYDRDTSYRTIADTTVNTEEVEILGETTYQIQLNYLNLPLAVGYQYTINSRWLIDAQIRGDFGFLSGSAGQYYDAESQSWREAADGNGIEKTTISYRVSAGAGYMFTPQWSLRLRPSFQQIIKGPYSDIEYRRNGWGLNLGLRYQF